MSANSSLLHLCMGARIVHFCTKKLRLLKRAESTAHVLLCCSDVAAFIREASILQRLTDCPYIIRFLGMCIEPGYYAIVMKYVENGNLEDMLLCGVDDHPIIKQWDCRIRMALDIAKGMNYLHSLPSPIIHRDLKTANVLVCRNYDCKVRYNLISFIN